MNARTLIIGLDGATFDVLDDLMQEGVMPFLRSFLDSGARADLRTIVPPLTPPAWTSLMTGVRPGHHGVFDFFRMEPDESRHIRFFNSNDIGCDTIWALADRYGKRSTVLNFPAMFPAPRIKGAIVPGWMPWKQLRLACWPQNLFDELKQLPSFSPRELAMDIKLEERATEGCSDPADYVPWIELHTRREENWLRVFEYLHDRQPADLNAVLFDGVDKLQHLCWRFLRPQDFTPLTEDWEIEVRNACLAYFRRLDSILERLCSLAGPEANVIIASDHGFGPTETVFHINAWLEQNGYLAWSDQAKRAAGDQALLGVGQVARHTFLMDWTRTRAFAATPTSNGIYIVRGTADTPGIPVSEYESFRSELIAKLRAVKDPQTGEPVVAEVWTREQAFGGPYSNLGPDITLGMADGGLVSILPNPQIVTRRPAVSGAHRPVGVFAAKGPAIQQGIQSRELSILDVPVLALHTIGVPPEPTMHGTLPEHILTARGLHRTAARVGAGSTVKPAPVPSFTPMDEQIIMDRLRELGYVE